MSLVVGSCITLSDEQPVVRSTCDQESLPFLVQKVQKDDLRVEARYMSQIGERPAHRFAFEKSYHGQLLTYRLLASTRTKPDIMHVDSVMSNGSTPLMQLCTGNGC